MASPYDIPSQAGDYIGGSHSPVVGSESCFVSATVFDPRGPATSSPPPPPREPSGDLGVTSSTSAGRAGTPNPPPSSAAAAAAAEAAVMASDNRIGAYLDELISSQKALTPESLSGGSDVVSSTGGGGGVDALVADLERLCAEVVSPVPDGDTGEAASRGSRPSPYLRPCPMDDGDGGFLVEASPSGGEVVQVLPCLEPTHARVRRVKAAIALLTRHVRPLLARAEAAGQGVMVGSTPPLPRATGGGGGGGGGPEVRSDDALTSSSRSSSWSCAGALAGGPAGESPLLSVTPAHRASAPCPYPTHGSGTRGGGPLPPEVGPTSPLQLPASLAEDSGSDGAQPQRQQTPPPEAGESAASRATSVAPIAPLSAAELARLAVARTQLARLYEARGRLLRRADRVLRAHADRHRAWEADESRTACYRCRRVFAFPFVSRHHCRRCGRLCCGQCSTRYGKVQDTAGAEADALGFDMDKDHADPNWCEAGGGGGGGLGYHPCRRVRITVKTEYTAKMVEDDPVDMPECRCDTYTYPLTYTPDLGPARDPPAEGGAAAGEGPAPHSFASAASSSPVPVPGDGWSHMDGGLGTASAPAGLAGDEGGLRSSSLAGAAAAVTTTTTRPMSQEVRICSPCYESCLAARTRDVTSRLSSANRYILDDGFYYYFVPLRTETLGLAAVMKNPGMAKKRAELLSSVAVERSADLVASAPQYAKATLRSAAQRTPQVLRTVGSIGSYAMKKSKAAAESYVTALKSAYYGTGSRAADDSSSGCGNFGGKEAGGSAREGTASLPLPPSDVDGVPTGDLHEGGVCSAASSVDASERTEDGGSARGGPSNDDDHPTPNGHGGPDGDEPVERAETSHTLLSGSTGFAATATAQ